MKPVKKELLVTGQRLTFSRTPQVDPEGQAAVREFKVEAPAGFQAQNHGAAGIANQQGTIPAIVQYGTTAGEMANGRRSACQACVAEGTLVFADGKLQPIEQAVASGARRTFIDGRWADVAARWPTGRKEVFEITTTHGLTVKVTPDHRIMTERGWVAAADLRSEFRPNGIADNRDVLDGPVGFEMSKTDAISRDEARFIGMIVGDGWIHRSGGAVIGTGFCYAEEMKEAWSPMLNYARARFGSEEQPHEMKRKSPSSLVQCAHPQRMEGVSWRNAEARRFAEGLDKDHVPALLWASTPEAIGAYLSGLFSTDGSVSVNPRPRVAFYQTRPTLVAEVQILLRSIGIYSRNYVELRAPQYKNLHYLSIAKHDSLEKFISLVGFLDRGRQQALESAVMERRTSRFKRRPSPERVRSVVACGSASVFDLSVPGPDAFLANGIRVHNCRHWDNAAWRKFIAFSEGPLARAEDKQTLQTLRNTITLRGIQYDHPNGKPMTVDEIVAAHGICRVLSDWVEGAVGRDPIHWPVVPGPDANCPPDCHAGAQKIDVVTPASPLGLFQPRDLDAVKIGDKRYDEVLRLAQGKTVTK